MKKKLIEQYLHSLMPSEKSYLERVKNKTALWMPQSKPQWLAFLSRADELFYGGAAGGGKTDLVIGMATECHQNSAIFRRVYPNLKEIMRRSREIIGDNAQENKSNRTWTWPGGKRTIEFGSVQHESDKSNWQGRAHDLKAFDELPEFTKSQYEFIIGWNRTTDECQRTRVIATGNPPMDEAGNWIIERWRAWLDPEYHNPAEDGELRWYATIDGQEKEFESGEPIEHKRETIYPRSRTFLPALLDDNPFYANDHRYRSVLQSLPEPLRSMLLNGDFQAAQKPNPFQVIPTEWVLAAQKRWKEREKPEGVPLTAVGVDPIWGGDDQMAIAKRYDNWFDEVTTHPGIVAKDGPTSAELIRQDIGDEEPATVNIDVIGVGTSTYDSAKAMFDKVTPINASGGSTYRDKSRKLKMRNVRAEYHWRMRDALDPQDGDNIALPDDRELLADLCAPRYKVTASGVQIEKKEEIKERISRSPDKGEAVMLCNIPPSLTASDLVAFV